MWRTCEMVKLFWHFCAILMIGQNLLTQRNLFSKYNLNTLYFINCLFEAVLYMHSLCGKKRFLFTAAWLAQLGGHWFKPRPDQQSGSLHNWEESAAFVICKRLHFLVFSNEDKKLYRSISRHFGFIYLVFVGRKTIQTAVWKE